MKCPYRFVTTTRIEKAYKGEIVKREVEEFAGCVYTECPAYDPNEEICLRVNADVGGMQL